MMAKKTDPKRNNQLFSEVSRLMNYINKNGGDTTMYNRGNSTGTVSDSAYAKTVPLPSRYLKENPHLAKEYPELYSFREDGGTNVFTGNIRRIREDAASEATSSRGATGGGYLDGNPQIPKRTVNNIIPRGGDSYTKAAIRSLFGAKDAYAYNVRTPNGEEWRPAASPSDAYNKLSSTSPSLAEGNRLFDRVKKKMKK